MYHVKRRKSWLLKSTNRILPAAVAAVCYKNSQKWALQSFYMVSLAASWLLSIYVLPAAVAAVCYKNSFSGVQCVTVCCSVLQRVAVSCSELQCVAAKKIFRLAHIHSCWKLRTLGTQCVAVCCCVLQCDAMWCSVLRCVAVCCGVLQSVAVCCREFLPRPSFFLFVKSQLYTCSI